MMAYIQTISFLEAKKLAGEAAQRKLERYMDNPDVSVLSDNYEEAECCWFFFRNRDIEGPPEQALRWDCEYAVSKRGEISTIGNLSTEPEKLKDICR